MCNRLVLCAAAVMSGLASTAQTAPSLNQMLERLERLERENREMRRELAALRAEIAARGAPGTAEEKLEIHDRRIEELAQTRVEAAQKLPLRIAGMALFNAFYGGRHSGGADLPAYAALDAGSPAAGATFRQTFLGLEYHGALTVFGGRVGGSVFADFFDGDGRYRSARLRTAAISIGWKTRTLTAGLEKPLFAPRNPTSLAQVGFSPLTGAGNLLLWIPQVRFEQRLQPWSRSGFRAQAAAVQTDETYSYERQGAPEYRYERRRPGLQGRFEWFYRLDESRRIEIAPGFHTSTSHVGSVSLPSKLVSLDWFANPWSRVEFSGALFSGQNIAHFGALGQGYTFRGGMVIPVHARGGWAQLAFLATPRVTFNIFGGTHDDRDREVFRGGIAANRVAAANVMYRIAPNVMVSFEGMRFRTAWLAGNRGNNRYDLAVAYLF